jgi:hypothetical protein
MSRSWVHCAKPVAPVARQSPEGREAIVALLLKRDRKPLAVADNRSGGGAEFHMKKAG